MKITICGSMTHQSSMLTWSKILEGAGYEVAMPNFQDERAYTDDPKKNALLKSGLMNKHFRKIDDSDAILVVNDDKNGVKNYIGGNTLIEIAYAYAQGLEIFLLNDVPEISYSDEINGMHPIIINSDINTINNYFSELPVVIVSTESVLKHRALSRGFRRAGIRARIKGIKVDSGVNEQPTSIDETYKGALGRQKNLHALVKSSEAIDYIVSIESGYHTAHTDHSPFGCTVVVIEKKGRDKKIGIDLDIEFPGSMTDKVPSIYPDIGVLAQQEYGAKDKDPFPYFTNNKLTRTKVLENAIYNVAIQL